MRIKFLGAAGMVTGSSYFLTGKDGRGLLIDMGMFQGKEEISRFNSFPLQVEVSKIGAVLLTHAHLDHCGRLPLLLRDGYGGEFFMTAATRDLLEITLRDTVKVARENGRDEIFDEDDVNNLLAKVVTHEVDEVFELGQFKIRFYEAGHILGAVSILVESEGKKVVFSGDLGNSPQDLIKPTEYVDAADYVVVESTYGDRVHSIEDIDERLVEEISEIEKNKGVLLIPAFSLERTQELLHRLDHLKKEGKVKNETMIFLDSPMAIKATEVFREHTDLYNQELTKHVSKDDPFDFPGLVVVEDAKESMGIKKIDGAKVIVAGSGMMSGGRIMNHAANYLSLPSTRVLFVGYQAEGTLGRIILEGAKSVYLNGKKTMVAAKITKIEGLSAHADQVQLMKWLSRIDGIKSIYVSHGEELARLSLRAKIADELGITKVFLPELNEEVDLR